MKIVINKPAKNKIYHSVGVPKENSPIFLTAIISSFEAPVLDKDKPIKVDNIQVGKMLMFERI